MIFAWPEQWKRVYERRNNHHGKFKSSSVANICTLLGLHVSKSQAKQIGKSISRHSKSKLTLFNIHAMSLFLFFFFFLVGSEYGEGGLRGPLCLNLTEHSADTEECASSLLF